MNDKNLRMAHDIAELVTHSGGRVYYVGGYVRDSVISSWQNWLSPLFPPPPPKAKDIDIEIHGLELPEVMKILESLGQVQTMGASFEILNLKHYELDISLPEDINGGAYKAALRRDFTINALMQDVLTGEILDYFGGLDDIANHVIRAVSTRTFELDVLRVFRAARFASVLEFNVDDDTIKLASRVKVNLLPCERVMNELALTLLKSREPSRFFDVINSMSRISNFTYYTHTHTHTPSTTDYWFPTVVAEVLPLVNSATKVRESAYEKLYFMMSALCCELDDDSCVNFLTRLTNKADLIKYVLNMKKLSAELIIAHSEESYMKIFDESICANDLLLLANLLDDSRSNERAKYLELYNSRMSEPYLTGRDLISQGLEQGVSLGRALKYAHRLRLAGFSRDEQLVMTLKHIQNGEIES